MSDTIQPTYWIFGTVNFIIKEINKFGGTIIPNKKLIKINRRWKVRCRMVMDEMEGKIWGHDRSRNIQSSQCEPSWKYEISHDPLPMDILQSWRHMSRSSSLSTNRRTQIFWDTLQLVRLSTSYDTRNNNK
jgi:hypothetical protein